MNPEGMSNNALRRLDRLRAKLARKSDRAKRERQKDRPTVAEQYGRPITRETIEAEMLRRGLLR